MSESAVELHMPARSRLIFQLQMMSEHLAELLLPVVQMLSPVQVSGLGSDPV